MSKCGLAMLRSGSRMPLIATAAVIAMKSFRPTRQTGALEADI